MESQDRKSSDEEKRGYTIVLDSRNPFSEIGGQSTPSPFAEPGFQDTPLPFSGSSYQPPKEVLPERLREMRRKFAYRWESMTDKAKNFYQQGRFMEDYEDDAPWSGDFVCYFPTYYDLNTRQLRGYFSWRTCVRRGEYHPIAASAAYLYLYELLNGIGASSPEDSLRKLRAFEEGYLNSGIGDGRMRQNLRRWMLEFAVVQNLPIETAREYADENLLQQDAALMILRSPEEHSDEEVFSALCQFGGKKFAQSPVLTKEADRGKHLFSEAWREASRHSLQGRSLFSLCFGERMRRPWYPLSNVVYYWQNRPKNADYVLSGCRSYHCINDIWRMEAYEKLGFDKGRFQSFLHEADLLLRRYLKTGRGLRERTEDAWAVPYIEAVIEADRRAVLEASRPKITIDFSELEQIRRDALTTRDSLLTEEDLAELKKLTETENLPEPEKRTEEEIIVKEQARLNGAESRAEKKTPAEAGEQKVPGIAENSSIKVTLPSALLDADQTRILFALLRGDSPEAYIRSLHLTPDLVADRINEALFDEIGDMVLSCEQDELSILEDYREDIAQMLGGTVQ